MRHSLTVEEKRVGSAPTRREWVCHALFDRKSFLRAADSPAVGEVSDGEDAFSVLAPGANRRVQLGLACKARRVRKAGGGSRRTSEGPGGLTLHLFSRSIDAVCGRVGTRHGQGNLNAWWRSGRRRPVLQKLETARREKMVQARVSYRAGRLSLSPLRAESCYADRRPSSLLQLITTIILPSEVALRTAWSARSVAPRASASETSLLPPDDHQLLHHPDAHPPYLSRVETRSLGMYLLRPHSIAELATAAEASVHFSTSYSLRSWLRSTGTFARCPRRTYMSS